jgi:hypothetical protein
MNATGLQIRLSRLSRLTEGAGTPGADRRSCERRRWSELMLRLLLLGLIGVAAYRIGSEFFRTIPSDFEPVPSPAGNPVRSGATDRQSRKSRSKDSDDAGDR